MKATAFLFSLTLLLLAAPVAQAFATGPANSVRTSPLRSSVTHDELPKSYVVPQAAATTELPAVVLHPTMTAVNQRRRVGLDRLELPKHSVEPTIPIVLEQLEAWGGRVAMVAALGLVVNELTTGQSLPDQLLSLLQTLSLS